MPKFEREIEIDAPVEKVWKTLIDPNHWPAWFPGMDSVSNVVATSASTRVEYMSDDKKGTAVIVSAEPMKRLEIMTQLGDDKDQHVFKLRSSGGFLGLSDDECKIEYTLDTLMGGGILGNFIAGGNPKDAIRVKKAVVLLRKLVESL
jgi:uncharacterized protein YndB with AHSA1/START domain